MKTITLIKFSFMMLLTIVLLASCKTKARISKTSSVYLWKNLNGAGVDPLSRLTPKTDSAVHATITEKTDYITITSYGSIADKFKPDTVIKKEDLPAGFRTEIAGTLYYPENIHDPKADSVHFRYSDVKHGLQAMSVLLKFRKETTPDKLPRIPPSVESGTSFGFAYGFKQNWHSYSVNKNIWGKNINTISLTAGPMIGGSAVDLKAATNTPGLNGDRKSAVISYGGFVMIGTGPINVGYAIGADRVLGYGASKWAYGGKIWHGVIVGLNLITF